MKGPEMTEGGERRTPNAERRTPKVGEPLLVVQGDCLDELGKLAAESVHCCVTSPPYWGLRDYGIPPTHWPDGSVCCFGLEPTPELYVAHSVLIFREVRRVLRRDGTLWLNLGDSYATGGGRVGECPGGGKQGEQWAGYKGSRGGHEGKHGYLDGANGVGPMTQPNRLPIAGRKPGDLVGVPWMVALALQADGWFLRRDNIWEKPNPMPESVNGWRWERCRVKTGTEPANAKKPSGWDTNPESTHHDPLGRFNDNQVQAVMMDCPGCRKCEKHGGLVLRKGNWRCTTSHEYVFQFSKSADYFCDAEAAREKTTGGAHARGLGVNPKAKTPGRNSRVPVDRDVAHASRPKQNSSFSAAVVGLVSSRNRRSVWRIATAPYAEAHFATFPPALVRPIIQAAAPVRCCAQCGAPYAPLVERGAPDLAHQRACGGDRAGEYHGEATKDFAGARAQDASAVKARILAGMVAKKVKDYLPTCGCGAESAPAVVLDPFGGSGTTGQVALELGRRAVLIELNPSYLPLIEKRTHVRGLAL
jgi:DNA modification methylase